MFLDISVFFFNKGLTASKKIFKIYSRVKYLTLHTKY